MNIFVWKLSKIAAQKKVFFFTFFGLLWVSVFFNGLFAPTSRSRMSNIFRDSEFLGKSNGKKWSQIWTFLLENCLKLPRKKKFFFFTFFCLLRFSVFFNGLFAPTSRSRMSNIFRDSDSLGKSNGKKWSNIWSFLFWSGLRSSRKKKFFFCWFCLGPPSYGIGATIRIGREMLCLPYAGFLKYILHTKEKESKQYKRVYASGIALGPETFSFDFPYICLQVLPNVVINSVCGSYAKL